MFISTLHKYKKDSLLVCPECFQFESSRLLLFCSEPRLQSRTMMLCRLGSTIPSRGLREGSPFQQASISCQHSSSKVGNRSGLAPGDNMDTSEPTDRIPQDPKSTNRSSEWVSTLCIQSWLFEVVSVKLPTTLQWMCVWIQKIKYLNLSSILERLSGLKEYFIHKTTFCWSLCLFHYFFYSWSLVIAWSHD